MEGRFEAAAAKYQETINALPAGNSLEPLARLNLGQSYEQAGQYDQAIAQYNLLKKSTGFTSQAYLGLGRMYLAKEDPVQARKVYKELLGSLEETPDPVLKSQIEAKLSTIDAGNPVIPTQTEENKE